MAHGRSDDEIVRTTHNTSRFFTVTRHVSWVLLLFTVAWGVYGYVSMPQRKDPDIPIRDALVVCPWPGASASRIEPLVTRRIEEKIAENARVERVLSSTRSSVAVVQVRLQKGVRDVGKEFDDIKLKLDSIHDLPPGAGPIRFVKDFGDTATLLLTVASPGIGEVEIALRARSIREALERTRHPGAPGPRVAVVYSFPRSVPPEVVRPHFSMFGRFGADEGAFSDIDFSRPSTSSARSPWVRRRTRAP